MMRIQNISTYPSCSRYRGVSAGHLPRLPMQKSFWLMARSSVYQGSRFFDAVNTAINGMGSDTINILNSGGSGPDGGNFYAIRPKADQTLDFRGHQIDANGGDLVVPVYCDRRNNITVKNLTLRCKQSIEHSAFKLLKISPWTRSANSCTANAVS